MKADAKLREEVIEQLTLEQGIDEREIGVAVKFGVVTLTGVVRNSVQQAAAEQAARKVFGVRAVVEEIKIKSGDNFKKSGHEIAQAAICALVQNISVPNDTILIEVKNGCIYLSGYVHWEYERVAAQKSLEHLMGVKNIFNNIQINQPVTTTNQAGISKDFVRRPK
jgi:osmotically-inducible protein OsmY